MIGGAQRAVDSWTPTTIVCTVPNTTGWVGPMPTTVYDTATTVESNAVIFNATTVEEEPTAEPTETPTEPSGGGAGYAPRATKSRKRTT
jgi:hypothetical protein